MDGLSTLDSRISTFLEVRQVTKRFPGVVALADVSLAVASGSCHGLVGENGAGKSTLAKVLAGIYRPDAGALVLDGMPVQFRNPRAALEAGIALVHQELTLCDNLSVADNLCLASLPASGPFLSSRRLMERARSELAAIGLAVDPRRRVGELPLSQRQLVQITAALGHGARVFILDEPTSSLSALESERLFAFIRGLQQRGASIVYVSHRLEEVLRLCDTVTVLRDGRVVATSARAACDEPALIQQMIGRPLDAYFPERPRPGDAPELLRVESLASPGRFADLSFTVRAGEIVGVAGLVGAGRTSMASAIAGLDPQATGCVAVGGRALQPRTARTAIDAGIGLAPDDRHRYGLVLSLPARDNVTLPILSRLARRLWLSRQAESRVARPIFTALRIGGDKETAITATLSGGTQQKLLLGRWLAAGCRVLILDEPTRGIDVGARAEIYRLIVRLAEEGSAILLISSDLPEILHLSTRILVMCRGRLVGELTGDEATEEQVMRLMTVGSRQ